MPYPLLCRAARVRACVCVCVCVFLCRVCFSPSYSLCTSSWLARSGLEAMADAAVAEGWTVYKEDRDYVCLVLCNDGLMLPCSNDLLDGIAKEDPEMQKVPSMRTYAHTRSSPRLPHPYSFPSFLPPTYPLGL